MSDDDKALVEALRDRKIVANNDPWLRADDLCVEAADRIEAQAAEIEKFSGIAKLAILKAYDTDKFSTARIEAQAAEIERLREAGDNLGFYAGHEDACDCVKGWAKGPCNCGYTEAWKAWRAALGETE